MSDITSEIVKWLTEKHSTGVRSIYGFESVLVIAVGIGAMVSAKSLVAKRNALKKRMTRDFSETHLIATLRAEEAGETVRYVATLGSTSEGLTVMIVREAGPDRVKSSSPSMRSLDEVDAWLRSSTPFILADFRN
ncbi:hypothetical protein ACW9HW_07190 [Pseudomonas sp. SDO5532_S415]